ncbi:MAG: tRNA (adenosine(37)-N6)-dimethylallyltransferase MiaA [Synechococcales cyanobacterium]
MPGLTPPGVLVIVGATATGKTALSLHVAQRLGSPILNADSRQVYQEMDIGTAKPTPEERRLCPHELWDLVPPTVQLTLADYQRLAQQRIAHWHTQDRIPLLVGGTGLYVQSLTDGLGIPPVPPHPTLRQSLYTLWQQGLASALLRQVDAEAAIQIHPHDAVRTVRALEVFYVTGIPITQWQRRDPPTYPVVLVGLACDRDVLHERIARRTRQMLEQGWIAEVEGLRAKYGPELPLLSSLGYGEIGAYLDGQLSREAMIATINQKTRHLAKQQTTWFRHKLYGIRWIDSQAPDLVDQVWAAMPQAWRNSA